MSKTNIFQELVPSLRLGSWASQSIRKHLFGEEKATIEELCQSMMESDGEFSSLLIAERIFSVYEKLDKEGLQEFFNFLNEKFDIDVNILLAAAEEYADTPDSRKLERLTIAAEPRRQELFRRLNLASEGTPRLVKMRSDLHQLAKQLPELKKMDVDFRHLFNSWFNRGFLLMQPIDWTTPAHILEKIIAYEAVHEIHNWRELRQRLEPEDRHCYAFFHPAMQDEPLVFVEVALTETIPTKISQILNSATEPVAAEEASCAIFYSISNCHGGLSGVSFGNFLIKQVATSLKLRFPQLKTFSTISPVPGFRKWLNQRASEEENIQQLLQQIDNDPTQLEESAVSDALARQASRYFLEQKNQREEPSDPVARFHLKNGARLERINIAADTSEKGMDQSLGLMVNYIYDLAKVEENHENYMKNHQVVCSNQVKKLLPH
jgi:malonyl-CoA decarboxylase